MRQLTLAIVFFCSVCSSLTAQELEPYTSVEAQPLKAQVQRVAQALSYLGQPLTGDSNERLQAAINEQVDLESVKSIQAVLDPLVIAAVNINPESRVKVAPGPARPELVQHGWSVYLVKVINEAGITPQLRVTSPNAAPVYRGSTGHPAPEIDISDSDIENRWMNAEMFDQQPLNQRLSGLEVEYRVVQIYSRDRGKREATLAFDVGQGTQDLGFRNELPILFESRPAVEVMLEVIDDDGEPTMASFVIRDEQGRVYPARSKRLAPDFFFHDQVYRKSGESILLPPGRYQVRYTRGPEYRVLQQSIEVPNQERHVEQFRLKRWVQLTNHQWYSGDHHVHAAGCAHYESPTHGVTPEDMMRHILGEDLNVGCVLSWGPCWYYQKQFFEGDLHQLSTKMYLMRYDVEVSGFPSSHAGHLCLLNLAEDDFEYTAPREFDWSYAGESGEFRGTKTEKIGEWPSWDLPVLKWGKEQGGVVGFSHSGWGLEVPTDDLPNYLMPAFDGIGANEYVVDVCHDAVDFISTVDTPAVWELNVWYHTLNCGYECRISGETDFPCIYGERVGLGRVYVKLDEDQPLTYEQWVLGLKDGRSYVGDGLSHLIDFKINELELGQPGSEGRSSVLAIEKGTKLNITAQATALLEDQPNEAIRSRRLEQQPYWHLERARVGNTQNVEVELIVNSEAVDKATLPADGNWEDIQFEFTPEQSSWIALRIFPSCHTNPIFVEVDGKPIRASKRSAKWCLDAVDACWKQKVSNTYARDREEAEAAYEFAREAYRRILEEATDDYGDASN